MKKIGLVLGGGGARGLCHIEFLKALDELNLKPSIISGTSMGAIVGTMYAAGMSGNDIDELLHEINFKDLFKMLDFSILSRSSLIKGKGVEEFLKTHIPAENFADLQIPMKIIATDFWRRNDIIFDSGELCPAIRSSIAIPALFEPVVVADRVLIDGGISNNLPIDIIRDDCDILIAIDVSGKKTVPINPKIPSWFVNVMDTFVILQSAVVEYQLKVCKPEIYIKPELRDIDILDFEKADKILESVQKDVSDFKEDLTKKLKSSRKILPF